VRRKIIIFITKIINFAEKDNNSSPNCSKKRKHNDDTLNTSTASSSVHPNLRNTENNYDKWCSITYYELAHKTGETFYGNTPTVTIDGFTDPDVNERRFSLGLLTNVNRENITTDVRRVIGKGIELVWRNHEVFIHCISNHSIFVQSTNCNHINGYDIYCVESTEWPQIEDF